MFVAVISNQNLRNLRESARNIFRKSAGKQSGKLRDCQKLNAECTKAFAKRANRSLRNLIAFD